jgi:hypothetical protein
MKPYLPWIALAGGILIAIWLFFWLGDKLDRVDEKQEYLLDIGIPDSTIIERTVNAAMQEVVKATAGYATEQQLRKSDDRVLKHIRDNVEGPLRNLERQTEIIATHVQKISDVQVTTSIEEGDTIQRFSYSDEWTPFMEGMIKNGILSLQYKVRQGYQIEYRWKKMEGLFKPKQLEITIVAQNPNTHIDHTRTTQIVDPIQWWNKPGNRTVGGIVIGVVGTLLLTK